MTTTALRDLTTIAAAFHTVRNLPGPPLTCEDVAAIISDDEYDQPIDLIPTDYPTVPSPPHKHRLYIIG